MARMAWFLNRRARRRPGINGKPQPLSLCERETAAACGSVMKPAPLQSGFPMMNFSDALHRLRRVGAEGGGEDLVGGDGLLGADAAEAVTEGAVALGEVGGPHLLHD